MAPLIVEATFGVAGAVIAEAGLSFLGLGVQPPQASWGSMIRDGVGYMLVAPHLVLAPGLAILSVVLGVNLAGDNLRDRLDVRSARRRGFRRTAQRLAEVLFTVDLVFVRGAESLCIDTESNQMPPFISYSNDRFPAETRRISWAVQVWGTRISKENSLA